MSPFEIVSVVIQLLITLLGAAGIGYYLGRTCGCGHACGCGHTHTEPSRKSEVPVQNQKSMKPILAVAPVAAMTKDDLKIVEGIGPAIERLLNAEGIQSYAQLTEAPVTRLEAILKAGGPIFASHNPASWSAQARLARDGQWHELETLKTELVGGLSIK
jgi:predicted flap endonuclease-1-like 5' DNA nuclease